MRNSNLVREQRTDKNGVTRNVWVKPQQGEARSTISTAAPSVAPAALTMKQQKTKVFGAMLSLVEMQGRRAKISAQRSDLILEKLSGFVDSASEVETDLIYDKVIVGEKAAVLLTAVSQMVVGNVRASPQTVVEFLALDEYHDYHPSRDYVERVQRFVMGLHSYDSNREPVDIEDEDSVRRNGALLKFTMDAVVEGPDSEIVEYEGEAVRIQGESVAELVMSNSEAFLNDPKNTKRLIGLINERGHEAGATMFHDPAYRDESPLKIGAL